MMQVHAEVVIHHEAFELFNENDGCGGHVLNGWECNENGGDEER